jgi:hypothetical protein
VREPTDAHRDSTTGFIVGALAVVAGLFFESCLTCIPSMTPCPSPGDVEGTYVVATTCAGGGEAELRVHDLVANRYNDCPSGCFATASAPFDVADGGPPLSGEYRSSCGADQGRLALVIPTDAGAIFACWLEVTQPGVDVPCQNELGDGDAGCSARLLRRP